MSEELKCLSCQQKDKEITKLKEDLEIQRKLAKQVCFDSEIAYKEAEKLKKMFYSLMDKQARVNINPPIIIVGEDIDALTNPTDNSEN